MQQPAFHVAKEYVVGGEGRWDLLAVDAKRHHLFISRSTHVQVVDTETGKVVADIPGTAGVHDIAIAEDIHSGFTSNGKSNTVTVFDLATLKVSETINIPGENPDVILYDPGTHHIFAFNGRSKNATVLDGASHRVLASVSLPGKPEIAVAGNNGKVYVNIEDKNEIAVIDTQTNKVVSTWPLGHGTEPTGLAIDPIHHRLFSVCANRTMAIVDSESGKLVAEKVIGDGPDSAAFDADLGMIFSANGDGTLTIVKQHDPDHYAVLQNLRTTKGARTMAYDPIAHTAYLVTALLDMSTAAAAGAKARPLIPESFRVLMVTPKSAY
jgi:YVTN family beta-propeller protein